MGGGGVGETEAKLFQVKTPVYISPSSNVPTNDDLNRLMSIKHNAQLLSKLQNDLRKTAWWRRWALKTLSATQFDEVRFSLLKINIII